jgi:methyl-accepting chemotaxis protein
LAQHERALLLQHIGTEFDTNVSQIVVRFIQSTDTVKGNAQNLSGVAAENAKRLKTLLSHSEQTNAGLEHVAAVAEQLSSSITQINQQVAIASQVTRNAVSKASNATQIMNALSDGAVKINAVLTIISQITSQINLLALNATIEAVRAGEQGKGFAVVASEVKNLAAKTASSTRVIAEYIGVISAQTKNAVEAIEEIQQTITTIDMISSDVAKAVVDQSNATQNITSIIQSSVKMSAESENIVKAVSQETQKMDTAAEEMLWECTTLSSESASLNSQAKLFVKNVKNS